MIWRATGFLALLSISAIAWGNMIDPTRPLSFQEASLLSCYQHKMLLQSINYGLNKRIVLIDGQFYELGDEVDAYKITAITPDSVELQQGDKKVILTL